MAAEQVNGEQSFSHGRGGAGNISRERRESFKEDLVTPTIKSDTYTTGRGGSGNMAKNDPKHPEVARARQDVTPPFHREPESTYHIGRGGAGNLGKLSEDEIRAAKQRNVRKSVDGDRPTGSEVKNWAEKGKDILGKLGGKH